MGTQWVTAPPMEAAEGLESLPPSHRLRLQCTEPLRGYRADPTSRCVRSGEAAERRKDAVRRPFRCRFGSPSTLGCSALLAVSAALALWATAVSAHSQRLRLCGRRRIEIEIEFESITLGGAIWSG